ncbi:MAG: hypothetical protein M1826_007217 [Phylliscum demangeonii]|nr:MAG: hypothetical protein M1826_007217 [Phylliscum demangeonii]
MGASAATLQDSPREMVRAMKLLRITADYAHFVRMNEQSQERQKIHEAALAASALKHEEVRRTVHAELERIEAREQVKPAEAKERDRIREEKLLLERAAREREAAAAQKAEQERKRIAVEEQRKVDEARKMADEIQKKAKAEAEARQKEADAQREAQRAQLSSGTVPPPAAPQLAADPSGGNRVQIMLADRDHQQYLEIHRRLKQLRRAMDNAGRLNPELKLKAGNMRREIRKSVGQLAQGKGADKIPTANLVKVMRLACQDTLGPRIDVRHYLLEHSPAPSSSGPQQASPELPALLIYSMNIFAKAIIAQFVNEASVSPRSADPVGVIAAAMFAKNEFRWGTRSLIDILVAKFHVHCPILFGIYGHEPTDDGRKLLAWAREEKDGPWVSERRHADRMTGLGAGFAAIGLRNFSKSAMQNPYPGVHYWHELHRIISLPPPEVTRTHYIVLRAMLENYEPRFIELFGSVAIAMLRAALVSFPAIALDLGAAGPLAVLPHALKSDRKLTLVGPR